MTYDEGIKWLQETLKGRQTLGLWKNEILAQKYSLVSGQMSWESFVSQRDSQMRKIYSQYLTEKSGNRPIKWTGGHTDIETLSSVLGEDLIVDSTEIGFIKELVEINGARGSFPADKVTEVVENMEALKACLERTTGEKVLDIPLCRETNALLNEMSISQNIYGREAYEANLRDKPLRTGVLSKIVDKMKELGRSPGEPTRLGDTQMPQMEEK